MGDFSGLPSALSLLVELSLEVLEVSPSTDRESTANINVACISAAEAAVDCLLQPDSLTVGVWASAYFPLRKPELNDGDGGGFFDADAGLAVAPLCACK